MWRSHSASRPLLLSIASKLIGSGMAETRILLPRRFLSSATDETVASPSPPPMGEDPLTFTEARSLMKLVRVETLKRRLVDREVMDRSDFLRHCEGMGIAKSPEEAADFVRVLDEAGVVLLFRDKVYLHPDKVVDLMRKAVPLALMPENDPGVEEFKELQKRKEDIDNLAHRHVRRILWSGLGFLVCQVGLFFRLTFWEFSWDVMEPVAFFTTSTGLVVGYAYFLYTSRDPTYQDFMQRLFVSRQRKLFQKQKFDVERFLHLQGRCKCLLDEVKGVENTILKD